MRVSNILLNGHNRYFIDLCTKMYTSSGVTFCTREYHYSNETEMEHARNLYVGGVSKEDIGEISDSEDEEYKPLE